MRKRFRSPGRDSGRSRKARMRHAKRPLRFNPLVGIPVVHAFRGAVDGWVSEVSIPWSGFRSFTRANSCGFGCGCICVSIPWSGFRSFTLVRSRPRVAVVVVSIPWSGFRSFTPGGAGQHRARDGGFNPLVGIPVVHAAQARGGGQRARVSIPWSGFRSFTPPRRGAGARTRGSFNPLVGIPVVHAIGRREFAQSLSHVSIPWSGFRSFTPSCAMFLARKSTVSIPWSGFRSFTPHRRHPEGAGRPGFNPLVGIPVVHALHAPHEDQVEHAFQSPGRDSGRSRQAAQEVAVGLRIGFNPLVGIPVVHARRRPAMTGGRSGFNPLVGIPVVHAMRDCDRLTDEERVSIPWSGFRSFTQARAGEGNRDRLVSIPWSGFRSFTPGHGGRRGGEHGVSIPWSGFRSFTLGSHLGGGFSVKGFNPLVGIPVVHAVHGLPRRHARPGFNPLVGIPVVHARDRARGRVWGRGFNPLVRIPVVHAVFFSLDGGDWQVSIPWSGFRSFTLTLKVPPASESKFQSPGRDSGRSRASRRGMGRYR